eukprot:15465983-Alexandrium_andersonii.AAC.1
MAGAELPEVVHAVWACSEFTGPTGGIRLAGTAEGHRPHAHGLKLIQDARTQAAGSRQARALR